MLKKEFIFGFHAVEAILKKNPETVLQLYRQQGREDKRLESIVSLAEKQHIAVQTVSKITLDNWTTQERHQGILVEIKPLPVKQEKDLFTFVDNLQKPPFLLLLDEIQDPHNLGACLRSANASGVDAVVITQNRSVSLTPTVRKVAVGAAETTPVFTVTNLANTLRKLKTAGLWIYGLDGTAKQSLYNIDLKVPLGLLLGSEGNGLRRLSKELCDDLLAIPMQGTVESLNVSVAAGVCLFEVLRQRCG